MKSRILFILHLPPPVHGAAMMGQIIKESKILNEAFHADYVNLSTSFSLDQIGKSSIHKYTTLAGIQAEIFKAIFLRKYELCYMTLTAKGAGFYKDLLVVAILKLFRKKIIYHFHNKGVALSSKSKLNTLLYRFAFNNTQSILLSPYLYYDIAKFVKEKDVYFCSNGISSLNKFQDMVKNDSRDAQQSCKLLFLSNMMVEKGVLVLLEACHLLKQRGLNFKCHFIGAWSDISETYFYKAIQEYNLAEFVFAHGKKYNKEKEEYFKNADIFVFPTFYHNETFGLVILEAMQAGLPVVSTFEGGIPDVVKDGETGILVPQRDPDLLADKLELLIQNPELRNKMGTAGKKRYEENFTLAQFEQNMRNILEAAIAK